MVRRYSGLAAACLLLVAVSGIISVSARLRGWSDLFDTAYGRVALVKIAVLLVAGGLGWLHRRRSLPALEAGRPWIFGRLAAVELCVLAVGLGAAVGLSFTPAPLAEDTGDATSVLGYPMPDALTALGIFTQWLVDPLIVCVAAAAVAAYGLAVLRLRRRGERWSWWRLTSWLAGWSVVVFVTCSGVAIYAPVLLSVHLGQHMTLAVVVPILLVLSGPVTLALRAAEPSTDQARRGVYEWITEVTHHPVTRMMAHPLMALGMYAGSLYAMYFTGLYELSLRSHAAHLAMIAHMVGAGYFFCWLLIGVDAPLARIGLRIRLFLLVMATVFHIGFGLVLIRSDRVLAADWFTTLPRDWGVSTLADQYLGGEIAWLITGVSFAVVLCVMIVQQRRERRIIGVRPDRTPVTG
jgi:putative copper resistance protein D